MSNLTQVEVNTYVQLARIGDKDAFGHLRAAYNPAIVTFIRTGIRGKNWSDAEDIAAKGWQKAWQDLQESANGGYDPDRGTFFTYLINRFIKFIITGTTA